MKGFVFTLIYLVCLNAYACRTVQWSDSEWIENSNSVYVVRVLSVTALGVEDFAFSYSDFPYREALISSRFSSEIDVVVLDNLKGKELSRTTVKLNECGGGNPKLANVGVLYQTGNRWHIKHGVNIVLLSKEALTKQSNTD